MFVYAIFIFLIGLVIGSFLTALTDRWPKEIPLDKGRSRCPKCKAQIKWYDNIPLFSYLVLNGKCRNCEKKISIRYPIIEFTTAILFVLTFSYFDHISSNILWLNLLPLYIALIFVLFIISILVAIFVIDLEYQYIPDRLIFWSLGITLILMLFAEYELIYINFLAGLLASLFLLSLNLATFGKGMGLGDVKLAIFIGLLLGYQLTILWLFLSFIIGSVIGLIMIGLSKAKFRQQIPFGPFLVISMIIVMFIGSRVINTLFPFIM